MSHMNIKAWLLRHWKLVLNLVTLVALFGLVYVTRHQLVATFHHLAHVNAWALLLIIPVELLNYHAQARLYQRLFAMVGNHLPYKFLYKASVELNFVNHVFPSGGVTGLSYFSLRLRNGKALTGSKATLVHLMKLILYLVSFELVLIFGVLSLAIMGRVNNLVILVSSSIATLLVVATVGFAYMVGSRSRINNFFTSVTQALNWLIKLVRPSRPETIKIDQARRIIDDFHNNYQAIKNNLKAMKVPFLYGLLANITEVLAVYVVYIAFGRLVNIGAVILAYAIANVAGLVSVLPGGFGIYEALMTAVLASTGIKPAVSLPVTVTYRVLNTLVQIPPGYYLYQRTLRHGEPTPIGVD